MSLKKINIAIIGATGYTGLDLVLLLSKHPKISNRDARELASYNHEGVRHTSLGP